MTDNIDNNIFTNPEGKWLEYTRTHAYKDSMLEILGEALEEVIVDCENLEERCKKSDSKYYLAIDTLAAMEEKCSKAISERDDMQKCAKRLFEELQAVVYASDYDEHYLEMILEEYRDKL